MTEKGTEDAGSDVTLERRKRYDFKLQTECERKGEVSEYTTAFITPPPLYHHHPHTTTNDKDVKVTAACIRVPVMRAHAESVNLQLASPLDEGPSETPYEGGVFYLDFSVPETLYSLLRFIQD
ncbi:hypothetical protein M8C21_004755 [Ambrosia artemisiifolia]|uniref:Uncharacterized protein n=1 Tax=Ambrosia artemisiifolia TaxID=4212 RepID=A0AAD5CUS7_AMBAR|nr:hypothetical protein M8C21_004755 [Ambrosia artemisiifolia]